MELDSERLECPLCAGRGTIRGRAFRRGAPIHYRCGLCAGAGSIFRAQIRSLQRLREQMRRVADLMQIGDAARAAEASRQAVRIARTMLPMDIWPSSAPRR